MRTSMALILVAILCVGLLSGCGDLVRVNKKSNRRTNNSEPSPSGTTTTTTGVSSFAGGMTQDGETAQSTILNQITMMATTTNNIPLTSAEDFVFVHSSTAFLTEEEIRTTLSIRTAHSPANNYAQDAINEIYARHGYVFKDAALRAYYEAKSWYTPNPSFAYDQLNEYEKKNIDLLKTF